MTDRRRHQRFVLQAAFEGTLRIAREVVVERFDGEALSVLSPLPVTVNELLQVNDVALRAPLGFDVRVIDCTPTVIEGVMQHRLRLAPVGQTEPLYKAGILGSLGKGISVRLLELNRVGCLLEADSAVEPGCLGELLLVVAGHFSSGIVRTVRCHPVQGRAGAFRIGAEFLSRGPRGYSLPLAVARLAEEAEWNDSMVGTSSNT